MEREAGGAGTRMWLTGILGGQEGGGRGWLENSVWIEQMNVGRKERTKSLVPWRHRYENGLLWKPGMAVLGSVGGPASCFYETLLTEITFKGIMDRLEVSLLLSPPCPGLKSYQVKIFPEIWGLRVSDPHYKKTSAFWSLTWGLWVLVYHW